MVNKESSDISYVKNMAYDFAYQLNVIKHLSDFMLNRLLIKKAENTKQFYHYVIRIYLKMMMNLIKNDS